MDCHYSRILVLESKSILVKVNAQVRVCALDMASSSSCTRQHGPVTKSYLHPALSSVCLKYEFILGHRLSAHGEDRCEFEYFAC